MLIYNFKILDINNINKKLKYNDVNINLNLYK